METIVLHLSAIAQGRWYTVYTRLYARLHAVRYSPFALNKSPPALYVRRWNCILGLYARTACLLCEVYILCIIRIPCMLCLMRVRVLCELRAPPAAQGVTYPWTIFCPESVYIICHVKTVENCRNIHNPYLLVCYIATSEKLKVLAIYSQH